MELLKQRQWKVGLKGRSNQHGFSVFVDNVPHTLDRFGLKGIFRRAGGVCDSFIPFKQSRSRKRYGFVRFYKEVDARNSILMFNNIMVRGFKISVRLAKYGKGSLSAIDTQGFKQPRRLEVNQKGRKEWTQKVSQDNQEKFFHMEQRKHTTVKGGENDVFREWLNRSVIGESGEPRDLDVLSAALVGNECSKVFALSKTKFILTYHTIEQMEKSLKNREALNKWFQEVKRWDVYEACNTRRAWIEVFGVPPHGWSLTNFELLASLWGKLVCLETPIEDTISFESMKVLIDTDRLQGIEGQVVLHIGDAGFLVTIKEASCTFQINPQFVSPGSAPSEEVKGLSEAKDGSEVHGEDVNASDDEVNSQRANGVGVGESSEESNRVSPRLELHEMASQHEASLNSSSKTKTAQLSQNGFSEELIKSANQVSTVQEEEVNKLIEPRNISGLENHPLEGSEESSCPSCPSCPPGFEAFKPTRSRSNQIMNTGKTLQDVLGRRLTRSQTRRERGLITRNNMSLRDITAGQRSREGCSQVNKSPKTTASGVNLATGSQTMNYKGTEVERKVALNRKVSSKGVREAKIKGSESVETTESLRKLAEESIEIGELLGVKVIANRENVVKRITQSLKSARSSQPNL